MVHCQNEAVAGNGVFSGAALSLAMFSTWDVYKYKAHAAYFNRHCSRRFLRPCFTSRSVVVIVEMVQWLCDGVVEKTLIWPSRFLWFIQVEHFVCTQLNWFNCFGRWWRQLASIENMLAPRAEACGTGDFIGTGMTSRSLNCHSLSVLQKTESIPSVDLFDQFGKFRSYPIRIFDWRCQNLWKYHIFYLKLNVNAFQCEVKSVSQ